MITKDTSKEAVLKLASECNKCGECCNYGSGFILPEEMSIIASQLNMPEEKFLEKYTQEQILFNKKVYKFKTKGKKPFGQCVFLDRGLCKIHFTKPINCKIANCNEFGEQLNEWFIANYLLDADDPVAIREWASRLISKPTIPGAGLHELVPDERKLKRIMHYKIIR